MSDPRFRFVKDILYSLKQEYGNRADLYHIISITQDPKTGKKIVNKTKYTIKKAVLLPTMLARRLAVEGLFSPSGQGNTPLSFDVKQRLIIVDNKDLPPNFNIQNNDYLVIKGERYDIKTIDSFEHNEAVLINSTVLETGEVEEIFEPLVKQLLLFDQEAVGVL